MRGIETGEEMSWGVIEHTGEILLTILIGVTTVYYGQLLFRGQRAKAATTLATTTIAQQDATITAQGERIELQDREMSHLRELLKSKDLLIESQGARISYLETVVTARDLIECQARVLHAGFRFLDVPEEILTRAAAAPA